MRSNGLICIQLFRSHFTACVAAVVWKPRISKEGEKKKQPKNSFQLDPSMRVFKFIQLVWKMFYESRGCRNSPSPRGACTPSNKHTNLPPHLLLLLLPILELGGFSTDSSKRESSGCSLFGGEHVILPWPECVFSLRV